MPPAVPIEPPIVIKNREQLLFTLIEAAEIEHNLMCCYLYAAWSMKTEADDDVDPETRVEITGWQRAILDIAIEEMTHLSLVVNIANAVGGAAHFERPNFPVAPGMLPAGLVVRLAPFNLETLQHFIFLERPEGSDEPDAASFAPAVAYERGQHGLLLTPTAQDYLTVGHLYRSVEAGLKALVANEGESRIFVGDPGLQMTTGIAGLAGLIAVTDLQSACAALEEIVEQGEGASSHHELGHFNRFVAVREALKLKPTGFQAAYPAATNPVMRHPPFPEGRVWVSRDDARGVIDLGNACYGHMLRCLMQGFMEVDPSQKRLMIETSIALMRAIVPLGQELARMKANDHDDCNAGLSFTTLRSASVPRRNDQTLRTLLYRTEELVQGALSLPPKPRIGRALAALRRVEGNLRSAVQAAEGTPRAAPVPETLKKTQQETPLPSTASPEIAESPDIDLIVDMKRCIHSRFCVTGAPRTFLANTPGKWLYPEQSDPELLARVAQNCPSGAIRYRAKAKVADEVAPQVNIMRMRENGPNAIHATLMVANKADGFRATFCRCGQSKNKPYCDGSHTAAGFVATGEPPTVSLDPLAARDGVLHVDPQLNGPLKITGNLEICAGTGRVVKRVETALLCRCGHSKNKPFCDGSHRAAGFQADGI